MSSVCSEFEFLFEWSSWLIMRKMLAVGWAMRSEGFAVYYLSDKKSIATSIVSISNPRCSPSRCLDNRQSKTGPWQMGGKYSNGWSDTIYVLVYKPNDRERMRCFALYCTIKACCFLSASTSRQTPTAMHEGADVLPHGAGYWSNPVLRQTVIKQSFTNQTASSFWKQFCMCERILNRSPVIVVHVLLHGWNRIWKLFNCIWWQWDNIVAPP